MTSTLHSQMSSGLRGSRHRFAYGTFSRLQCTGPGIRQTPALCPPKPRTFSQHGAFRPIVFAAAGADFANDSNRMHMVQQQLKQLNAEADRLADQLKLARSDLSYDRRNELLLKAVDEVKKELAGLDERRKPFEAMLLGVPHLPLATGAEGPAGQPTYKHLRFILPGSLDTDAVLFDVPAKSQPFITNQAVLKLLESNDVTGVSDVTDAFELGLSTEKGVKDVTPPKEFNPVTGTKFIDGHIYWTYVKGRMPKVSGWMRSMVRGLESHAVEKGLAVMKAMHPNVHVERVCQKQFTLADGSKVKLDGLIEAGTCVLMVEVKTKITKATIMEIEEKLAEIQSIKQTDPLAHRFYNKEVRVAIAGRAIDEPARQVVQEKMKLGWLVWLPDATGLQLGDACFCAT